ncbi:MAG TPA: hypothetical protein VF468_30420 [Actinomycetota bacterium]|nr:hypothetical protein [Actinomycetota bacterium]
MTTSSDSTSSSGGRAEPGTMIVFTPQGRAALDRLAATLTAGCDSNSSLDQIAGVLEQVLHAPLDDLAAALTPTPASTGFRPPALRRDTIGRARSRG